MKKLCLFAMAAVIGLSAASVFAGTVTIELVKDPAAIGCTGCTLSGTGTYQIFASVTGDDNTGIAGYSIPVSGVNTMIHRSPRVNLSTLDPDGEEDSGDETSGPAGFSNFRVPNNNQNAIGGAVFNFGASQDYFTPTPWLITGYGKQASSFAAKLPGHINAGVVQTSWAARLLLAEGTYLQDMSPKIVGGSVDLSANLFAQGGGVIAGLIDVINPVTGVAPDVEDLLLPQTDGSAAANPTPITGIVQLLAGTEPITWSNFMLESYTPNYSGAGTGPYFDADFDPLTQEFSWNPVGSPRGDYVWKVTASNSIGEDTARIYVSIQTVPEPATLAIVGLGLIGLVGVARRRS